MQSIKEILNDPEYAELLETPNSEEYKGWLIYDDHGGKTTASRINNGTELNYMTVEGVSHSHRRAIKLKIDEVGSEV